MNEYRMLSVADRERVQSAIYLRGIHIGRLLNMNSSRRCHVPMRGNHIAIGPVTDLSLLMVKMQRRDADVDWLDIGPQHQF